ncbi:MAG: ABC transporter substrate-binding protein [Chryseobacterium sp.]|nr:ABC transporter substrate-binding protein [Chryseobacterium sp.]
MRVISLVPSITEALFDLGLATDEIVGRTKFCIHPKDWVDKVEIIGGTKNLNIDKIKALEPDLIIANKEENIKEQVEELMKHADVWLTDIETLADNEKFLTDLGKLLNKEEKAADFNLRIRKVFEENIVSQPIKVAYLIWKNPYMSVGGDTFISNVIEKLGLVNLLTNETRYPEISIAKMQEADYIFLSSEPFPFRQQHIDELQAQLPNQKIILVDGEAFSWYGTHLAKCAVYYRELVTQI